MNIKNKSKYLYLYLYLSFSLLFCNTYFSYSSFSNKNESILSCYDEIYYPRIITNFNKKLDYRIDMRIQENRIPQIITGYDNKYTVSLKLQRTNIKHHNTSIEYTNN